MKKYLILLLAVAAVLTAMLSCGQGQQSAEKQSEADSLLVAVWNAGDYERVIVIADSLDQTGDISPMKSAYYQGGAYAMQNHLRHAEEVLKPVKDMTPTTSQDSACYIDCLCIMAGIYNVRDDYEGVLRIALPLLEKMNGAEDKKNHSFGLLTQNVAMAQLSLGMKEDAAKSFDMSYNVTQELSVSNPTWGTLFNLFIRTYNTFGCYSGIEDYEGAMKWCHRQDSVLAILSERDSVPASSLDECIALNCFSHADLAIGQNYLTEGNRAIDDYKKTEFSKTLMGQLECARILLKAKRYAEAADAFAIMDQYLAETARELSLDNISHFYGEKYEANYKAGRRDSALAVAAYIVENLDSAIAKEKNNAAAELATVYQTQQKDAEIAQQQITLSRQRWIGTLAALVLLTTFFIIYTLHRRRAQKRLAAAHQQLEAAHENLETAHTELQTAYDQLEETTTAKERIESELRIARNIQMSMVPGVFPERKGLDMYAEMTPAKEVGGDLYGYVLQGDMLYFCVGDVSGKGVPASLFMAQSARLFRTLAAEGMMPADIATRMNNELVEGNDSFMFVTMFIGLLHLDTGRLDFCNCGHNAPVYDGQFLKMQYVNQMIGVLEGAPFYGESIEDIRNHQLLVYTDGLNEAENTQHELLGDDRLLELMADAQSLDSHQLIGMMKEAVEQHRNGAEPSDDLTLMYLKLQ